MLGYDFHERNKSVFKYVKKLISHNWEQENDFLQ